MKFTKEQLTTGHALSAYNALMRWFDKASGVQTSGEDSVKCMIWLEYIIKLIRESSEYQFISDHSDEIWSLSVKEAKEKLKEIKEIAGVQ